ncbi:hypothetical protein LINGRAHAP2_LOCUS12221 [Linum grandiflorum]
MQQSGNISHNHQTEVLAFRKLRYQDWELTLHHSYREANRTADFLTDLGRSLPHGFHSIPPSDPNLVPIYCMMS